MIRTAARNTILLGAMALVTGATAVSCSGKKGTATDIARADVGSVSLQLRLASGAEIRTVSYTISGNGITPRTGTIDVSGSASPSILVTGLPPGTGYTVSLTATSVDGGTTCSGSATFSITAGATTSVTVGLQCRAAATTGNVSVGTTINNCPVITSVVVSPTQAAEGGTVSVAASASDVDPMETLTYAWSSPQGTFAMPASASTTYACTPAGPRLLTLTVGDGECEEAFTVTVTCGGVPTGPVCGNGIVEAPETCEPPGSSTCSATCQTIAGTGGTGGGTGGTGGATGGTGGATGGTGGATGGTGGATGGTGGATGGTGGATGGTGGTGGATGGTGGATGGTGGATGGTGGATGGTGGATGGTGGSTGGTGGGPSAACTMCMDNNCPAELAGCAGFAGQDRADCDALMACTERTGCASSGDGQGCYCGTADIGACLGGGANGACKAEVEVAGKSTMPQQLGERFTDPAFPVGRAFNFYGCRAAFCAAECTP